MRNTLRARRIRARVLRADAITATTYGWLLCWMGVAGWTEPQPTAASAAAHDERISSMHAHAITVGDDAMAYADDVVIDRMLAAVVRSLPTPVHAAALGGHSVVQFAVEAALFAAVAADPDAETLSRVVETAGAAGDDVLRDPLV